MAVVLAVCIVTRAPKPWTISSRGKTLPDHQRGRSLPAGPLLGHAPAYQFAGELGFHIVDRWQFHFAQFTKSTRWRLAAKNPQLPRRRCRNWSAPAGLLLKLSCAHGKHAEQEHS